MLQCTPAAARSLDEARSQRGLPDSCGPRLFPVETPEGAVGLGVELTEPVEGDQVVDQHGTRLILAPEIVDQLAEMTLDVEPDPTSNGDVPAQLVLRSRSG